MRAIPTIPTDEQFERLLLAVEKVDPDAADRFEAALEVFWGDDVSRVELAEQMRELLRDERRGV